MEQRQMEHRQAQADRARRPQDARASDEESAGVFEARAQALMAQAEDVLSRFGTDMLEAFRRDATVREKVLSGEWDFYIAYGWLLGRESAQRRSVPAAVRAPNNANTRQSVAGLSAKWRRWTSAWRAAKSSTCDKKEEKPIWQCLTI